jgi:hypothetical protein
MKKRKLLIGLVVALSPILLEAQSHIIGSFPTMDGGIEGQTVGTTPNVASTTLATGIQQTAYTSAQATSSVGTIANTGARSGTKCIQWTTSSTSNLLWTPTASNAAIVGGTSYVVQFYYTYASGSARAFVVGVTTDGTSGSSTATTSSLAVASTYTKVSVVVTPGTSTNSPRYGMITFKPSGGSFSTPYVLDDIVMYAGTAEDVTAPNSATAANVTSPSSTSLTVNWTAPSGGVDGGGYLVVRGTTDPTTAPNVNGIYAVGNTIGSNGTVAYIGTNTSFVDNGLTPNTTYFYRVYAVDKAFNYSTSVSTSGFTGTTPILFSSFAVAPKSNGLQVNWSTVLETNMDKFIVERSSNGKDFNVNATITPNNGGNAVSHYSWLDLNPSSGTNFYRIKAQEKDGSIKFSSIVKAVLSKTQPQVLIAPNPVENGLINLQVANLPKGYYALKVINTSGQTFLQKQLMFDGNFTTFTFQLSNGYIAGTYILTIEGNGYSSTQKLLIQ